MQSTHPNRFFGLNPVSVAGSGPRKSKWSYDLPTTWRDAVADAPAIATPVIPDPDTGDSDDA